MTGVVLRPARPEDLPSIAVARARTWQAAYAAQVDADDLRRLTTPEALEAWVVRAAEGTSTTFWVAEVAGSTAGFAAFGAERAESPVLWRGEVHALYVAPEHWRTGLGSSLLHVALDELTERGHDVVTLWVLDGNEPALAFYRRHGFHMTGETSHDARGHPEVRMSRLLGPRGDLVHQHR